MRKGPDYTCEWCKAVLSDRGVGEDHISLPIAPGGGVASLLTGLIGYRMLKLLRSRRYHFCGIDCLARYFARVLGLPLPAGMEPDGPSGLYHAPEYAN